MSIATENKNPVNEKKGNDLIFGMKNN